MQITLTETKTKFVDSTAKATALVSGFGGGKTFTLVTKMLMTKMKYPSIDLLYLAPTFPLVRDVLYPTIEEILAETDIVFKINRSDNDIIFERYGKILCRTMDNPARIIGMNVGDIFFDELDTLTEEKALHVWNKAIARGRANFPDGKKNQLWVATTPEGFKFTYKKFKKEPPPDYSLLQMSSLDNKYLPNDYIQSLKDLYPAQLIKAYVDGDFVNLTSGSVYQYDKEKHNSKEIHQQYEPIHVGMDFNVRNMSAVISVKRKDKFHAVAEFQGVLDTPTMVDYLKDRYNGCSIVVYPDASGGNTTSKSASRSDISLLEDAGFSTDAPKKNPFIKDRVNAVNGALEHGNWFVNSDLCPRLSETLTQQIYDKNGMPEKLHDNNIDDMNDAFGYKVSRLLPIIKPVSQLKVRF